MTAFCFLYLMAETMVTVAMPHVSFRSAKETNAFVPHPYAQAAHMYISKLLKEKQKFLGYFK